MQAWKPATTRLRFAFCICEQSDKSYLNPTNKNDGGVMLRHTVIYYLILS